MGYDMSWRVQPPEMEDASADATRIFYERIAIRATSGRKTVRVMTVTDRGPKELLFHGRKGPCLIAARRLDPNVRPNW